MTKMIFINLAVQNLPKARAFYEPLGATNNPQFSDETAACMVFSDTLRRHALRCLVRLRGVRLRGSHQCGNNGG
jgi:hypothetical protein